MFAKSDFLFAKSNRFRLNAMTNAPFANFQFAKSNRFRLNATTHASFANRIFANVNAKRSGANYVFAPLPLAF